MILKKIFEQLNIFGQCRKYGVSIWQCPQFLFLLMGLIIIISTLGVYFIGQKYITDPLTVSLIVLFISFLLLIIAATISRSFERLAEANRMKSEFISIVSHQLRSPLTNLKWTIDLLMSGSLGKIEEEQIEYFKVLKESNNRMQDLISDLLTVSRIETSRLVFKEEKFSFLNLVKEIIKEFESFAKAHNVQIELKAEDNILEVSTDLFQIRQVIGNLLDNAIHYTKDKGKIDISISKKVKIIKFEIKDTGVGIPAEDQKYIFNKFFRSSNAMRHQTQGTGLGLYIAKSMIEKSGGKIGFKSEENKGSTFWFTLPIK